MAAERGRQADSQSIEKRADQRITRDGVVVIKSQQHRSQEKNKEEALARLEALIRRAMVTRKPRKPTRAAREKRVDSKTKRGRLKQSRGRIEDD
ncbi:hypothetical protein BH24PSE2_BH24PSE2_23460 [soil metagenome]